MKQKIIKELNYLKGKVYDGQTKIIDVDNIIKIIEKSDIIDLKENIIVGYLYNKKNIHESLGKSKKITPKIFNELKKCLENNEGAWEFSDELLNATYAEIINDMENEIF